MSWSKRYEVILADPPWRYDFSRSDSRKIENQYPSMSMQELIEMRPFIDTLHSAVEGAVMFMWATAPKLPEAMQLLSAWGFEYKTCDVWVKLAYDKHREQLSLSRELEPEDKLLMGMGYYTRVRHELLLIGTAGKILAPAPEARPVSVFYAERGRHSEKPQLAHERIELMYPAGRRIELFARTRRVGWDAWGNEVPDDTTQPTEAQ